MKSDCSALELEVKQFIIDSLSLEDVTPEDIQTESPLFGDGLGLDSIDALELGVAVQRKYNIKLDPKDDLTRQHFASVKNLAALIASTRTSCN